MIDVHLFALTSADAERIVTALELLNDTYFGEDPDVLRLIEYMTPARIEIEELPFNTEVVEGLTEYNGVLVLGGGTAGVETGRLTRPGGSGFSDFFADEEGFTE